MTAATLERDAVRVVRSTRTRAAGLDPDPGASSRLPAWWGAEDWVQLEVPAAVWANRDVCRAHHVEPDTVVAVARGHAAFADYRTGRDCRPTNARLVELLRVSLSTVQRARRVLKELGLLVEQVRGRSFMTRAERLEAWRRGSSHRKVAAVFALCSRRARGPKKGDGSNRERNALSTGARPAVVERDTPPGAWGESVPLSVRSVPLLRAEPSNDEGAPRPLTTKESRGRRRPAVDPVARRLAEATRWRLGWLAEVPVRRLTPPLSRFARAGWTPRDVDRAVSEVLAARGWRVPRGLRQPAAYLAGLLRELDPADRPGAVDEQLAADERRERDYRRQLIHGAPCPHGTPAGHVPSPLRGLLACPACRAAAAAAVDWP